MSRRAIARQLNELEAGPCGRLADILASRGCTSSLVTRPRPGILIDPGTARILMSLIPAPAPPLSIWVTGPEPGILISPATAHTLLAQITTAEQEN